MTTDFRIFPLGDAAAVVEFRGGEEEAFAAVSALARVLSRDPPAGVVECVPAFATLTIFYDSLALSRSAASTSREGAVCQAENFSVAYNRLLLHLEHLIAASDPTAPRGSRAIELPVCYGGSFGEDIGFVAEHNGLTIEEVIALHTGGDYRVRMIGFAPGFPYLGGLTPRLATPRLPSPRRRVSAGSVGIGGTQTGVYSIESPGGWRLIGRTPLELFRPHAARPSLLHAGDRVLFRSITLDEFEYIASVCKS